MGACKSKADSPQAVAAIPAKTLLVSKSNGVEKGHLLLGGYSVGDTVYFKGTSISFPSGNKLVYGRQGKVLGPAMLSQMRDKGLQVQFPDNAGPVDCALRSLSRSRVNEQVEAANTAKVTSRTLLGPVVNHFSEALGSANTGAAEADDSVDVDRHMLLCGLDSFIVVLDSVSGGKLGCYLSDNVQKLRNSKATASDSGYRAWMLSELPVHAATGYKEYVDKSAWMANLWIAWTLEFFVELFAQLETGKDTKSAVDVAYKQTLYKHHNMFQRAAFTAAMKQLPCREQMLRSLQGTRGASTSDVVNDIGSFVKLGRVFVQAGLELNDELDALLKNTRASTR